MFIHEASIFVIAFAFVVVSMLYAAWCFSVASQLLNSSIRVNCVVVILCCAEVTTTQYVLSWTCNQWLWRCELRSYRLSKGPNNVFTFSWAGYRAAGFYNNFTHTVMLTMIRSIWQSGSATPMTGCAIWHRPRLNAQCYTSTGCPTNRYGHSW